MANECENCRYNFFDDETQECFCGLELDEDEFAKLLYDKSKKCKYFIPDIDEYGIVRKQN